MLLVQLGMLHPQELSQHHCFCVLMVYATAAVSCRGKVILTAAKQVAKWTLPSFICKDNLGEVAPAVCCLKAVRAYACNLRAFWSPVCIPQSVCVVHDKLHGLHLSHL